ncbi:MAG: hypothetical protein Q9190_006785 [Brigantiaea leucoxantha]
MAESITEGTLKQWSKQIGDYVEQDEEIATIETDKIDVAVNAPEAGTIKEYLAKEEDTVTVGQDIVMLELGGEPKGGTEEKAGQKPKEPAPSDQPSSSDPKPSTDSSESKKSSPSSEEPPPKQPEAPKKAQEPKPQKEQQPQSPRKEDTQPPPPPPKPTKKASESTDSTEAPPPYGSREERRVKMNRMRLRIAERLKQSQNTAASLTTFNEVDMSSLMQFRKTYKDEILKKSGVKLGFMGAFSRACVLAMKDVPAVNASIEGPGGGDTIVYRDYVDISVAVATEKGLVTPVVRNAESLDIIGTERKIAELGKKVGSSPSPTMIRVLIRFMQGSGQQAHNRGHGRWFLYNKQRRSLRLINGNTHHQPPPNRYIKSPTLNLQPLTTTTNTSIPPAVLGLHAIKEKPVAIAGKVEIRPMMYLALTYDHRLLDGREAVIFLVKVKEFIEDPMKMLLG